VKLELSFASDKLHKEVRTWNRPLPVCHWQAAHEILLESRTLRRPASAESSEFSLLHWLAAAWIGAAIKRSHGGLPVAHERRR
jgi:hypothetical protein